MERTITALATPPGVSGLAIIRVSGPEAIDICDAIYRGSSLINDAKANTILVGEIADGNNIIDQVTISIFRAPRSYTGEDVIEIGCHGGMIVYMKIIELLTANGAVMAEPGEFTRRAFMNGKLDLTQVEAVADIIHSETEIGTENAARQISGSLKNAVAELRNLLLNVSGLLELELDFADEEIELADRSEVIAKLKRAVEYCRMLTLSYEQARLYKHGYYVCLTGFPNSGKSTLFNKLLESDRAIVSEVPGTTRDYISETIILHGMPIKIFDTAGIRQTSDSIEIQGIRFVESIMKKSDMIIVLNDISNNISGSDQLLRGLKERYNSAEIVLLQNKIDKTDISQRENELKVSAKYGLDIDVLKEYIIQKAESSLSRGKDILANERQAILFRRAEEDITNAIKALKSGMTNEILSIDIRNAAKALGEITGESWSEEVLNNIFSKFCIGK